MRGAQANDDEEDGCKRFLIALSTVYMLMLGIQSRLEFELRMQQYIELRRNGQVVEARQHAQKYLTQHANTYPKEVNRAAGLLAYPPDTQVQEYNVCFSSKVLLLGD